jgi:hypothetical protein
MTTADHIRAARGPWQTAHAPVPQRYRGLWRRTLLQTPQQEDTTTTVFWLQTACWHADLRIPAQRPDFAGVTDLAGCNAAQLAWLASQQGFAGATEVTVSQQGELCAWHRRIDFQPPAAGPDVGLMDFTPAHLVETGLYASYLEHWVMAPDSTAGMVVLQRLQDASMAEQVPGAGENETAAAIPVELLLVAGDHVMHVRGRGTAWPAGTPADTRLADMPQNLLPALLDFSIAHGRRTAAGWTIQHATLPWLEGSAVSLSCERIGDTLAQLTWDGQTSCWQVLEWHAPGTPDAAVF